MKETGDGGSWELRNELGEASLVGVRRVAVGARLAHGRSEASRGAGHRCGQSPREEEEGRAAEKGRAIGCVR
jgi:hypothetical protein